MKFRVCKPHTRYIDQLVAGTTIVSIDNVGSGLYLSKLAKHDAKGELITCPLKRGVWGMYSHRKPKRIKEYSTHSWYEI